MNTTVNKQDAKISHLKATLQQVTIEGPGTMDALYAKNQELKEHVKDLNIEFKGHNAKVKDLTKQLRNAHATENTRIDLVH